MLLHKVLAPKGVVAYYLQDKVNNLYSLALDEFF